MKRAGGQTNRAGVRRLALGRLLSLTGSSAAVTALTFLLYEREGSSFWIAATALATWGIAGVLGPIAGSLGDRFDRRAVMALSDVGAAAVWATMAAFDASSWELISLAFVGSIVGAPFGPASAASIPNLAGEKDIGWANSLVAVGSNAALTLGPFLGGLSVATLSPKIIFGLNTVSYLASAGLVLSVRADFNKRDEADVFRRVGWRTVTAYLSRDPVLRHLLLALTVLILTMATAAVADPVLAEDFRMGGAGYGFMTAAWGVGSILGAVWGRAVPSHRERQALVVITLIVSILSFGIAASQAFWVVVVLLFLFGLVDGPSDVFEHNIVQRRTPDHIRARVFGIWYAVEQVAAVGAILLGGVLVDELGAQGTYVFAGIGGLIGTVLLLPLIRTSAQRLPRSDPTGHHPVSDTPLEGPWDRLRGHD